MIHQFVAKELFEVRPHALQPRNTIDYGGGNNTQTVCTQLIGDTVTFSANAYLAVNCTGMGVRMWGTGAKLSE